MQCVHCATPVPDDARFCHSCGSLVSDAEGAARVSGAMTPDSYDKIEQLLRKETEGQYVIQRMIGKGGMAVVYLAREVHLARNVAIKVLPPELTFGHGVERFKREAKVAAALDHPNIIPVYRVSTEGTLFWYAMKYLEGQSLEQVLKERGKLPLKDAIKILHQVADALDYAHERQVVHRDMKPANVMLDSRNRVIVTDFGIAKALSEGTLTASGSVIGTPYFMSPEQGMGKPVSGASDQYSVAVMAYRMIAGRVPFEGDSAIDVLHKHCMVQPPPLESTAPGMPRHVYLAVHRALDKKAENRFPTVGDFVRALESPDALGAASPAASLGGTGAGDATLVVSSGAVSHADLATTPMPSMGRSMPGAADPTMATPPPTPQTIPPSSSLRIVKKKRSPLGLVAAGLIVLGGGAAGVYFATRGGGAAEPVAQVPVETQAPAATPVPQAPPPQPVDTVTLPPTRTEAPAAQPPVSETPPARPTPAAPTTGTLFVTRLPSGASIVIDGGRVVRGQSSVDLPPGTHTVTLAAGGYEPQEQSIRITAGQTTRIDFAGRAIQQAAPPPPVQAAPPTRPSQPTLSSVQGLLRVGLNVVADISIDREWRAKRNRYEEIVLAGDHLVDLRADGFRDTTVTVRIRGRDTVVVRVDLQRR
jgi:serine/threonine protein kinase